MGLEPSLESCLTWRDAAPAPRRFMFNPLVTGAPHIRCALQGSLSPTLSPFAHTIPHAYCPRSPHVTCPE
jgi:hypothetical protein